MSTPKPWADTPYPLLTIPGQPGTPTCPDPAILSVAIEMANVHNLLLRGLNSIYLQAPHVTDPVDIADLLLYAKAWADTVHHHHSHEEKILFPRIDALANDAGVQVTMHANVDQHHLFEPRIAEMMAWVDEARQGTKEFDSKVLLGLIDAFAPILTKHLHEEIETLLGLEGLDGEKVKKAMADTANEGIKTADTVCFVCILLLDCIEGLLTARL
jgi:hemerythrin-like domain-containing protein